MAEGPFASEAFKQQIRDVNAHLTSKNLYAIIGVTHYVDTISKSIDGDIITVTLKAYPHA